MRIEVLFLLFLQLARFYTKFFESKIAALLDTHSLVASDAETKQLIGCKWVMGTVDCQVR